MTVRLRNGFCRYKDLNVPANTSFLKILILNLMPHKAATEKQYSQLFSELASNTELTFMVPETHSWHHGNSRALRDHYATLTKVADDYFDALIVTGAPLEKIDYQDVDYWPEFETIMDWSLTHTGKQIFTCWSALAALNHDFQIPKINLTEKIFGVYQATDQACFPIRLQMPQSRFATIDPEQIKAQPGLSILAQNETIGPFLLQDTKIDRWYVLGHPEYSAFTLLQEYQRDLTKGLPVQPPQNFALTAPQLTYAHWRNSSRYLFQKFLQSNPKESSTYEQKQLQL
ncbi:homoserine O-succinyltransferase [Lactobacillus sp. CC-MHH1034]|uniref:homoserine O-acetyltransferase/O-succinyltransferase family protein n=1 Tax=Agrilactobacillus fermenti TaxID=2586909 RepID=UPI001E38CC93|nr:homoserine O-succinyltransferase [Agrilactobacillus fermenti]MCD2257481.1 homoserine O-succinyltransferase [Agrilactobacillus fermenti]